MPDDPYLVVAADKGTATFSDYANAISREYGFWLDDAFASGGSVGYDHKAMGITARGAWESVKRHFRELRHSTRRRPISRSSASATCPATCSATACCCRRTSDCWRRSTIGTSSSIRTRTPRRRLRERERLFRLPRSSWADYDPRLMSTGGGVHPRSAKSIAITPEVKAALAITADRLTPTELVNAILKAPVDLLYNGGIGTYVKATSETHAQVGDRANDALRVNGRELRCKVVVEGGNLGCTQLGRIEYAQAGGRINTDAIDNSAGVDTSDHEVNIKILLGLAVADGELTGEAAQRAARRNDRRRRRAGAARQLLPDAGAVGDRTHRAANCSTRSSGSSSSSRSPGDSIARSSSCRRTTNSRSGARAGRGSRVPSARSCSPTERCGSTTSSSRRRCRTIRGSRARSPGTFPGR